MVVKNEDEENTRLSPHYFCTHVVIFSYFSYPNSVMINKKAAGRRALLIAVFSSSPLNNIIHMGAIRIRSEKKRKAIALCYATLGSLVFVRFSRACFMFYVRCASAFDDARSRKHGGYYLL
mmetsp:Transcript_29993/g.51027  ORF Transcript_29993/g.51027 Transcript_29993/m.51027 type:complete len:121 (-) Transcript_29993:201-563(-)